jgi:hypothetical protein
MGGLWLMKKGELVINKSIWRYKTKNPSQVQPEWIFTLFLINFTKLIDFYLSRV